MRSAKIAFVFFFIYFLLQGALRKWYFPGLGTPLYLFVYVALFFFYVTMQGKSNAGSKVSPAFYGFLMVYVVYAFLEIFNLRGTDNLIVQMYGFLMTFAFVPLLFYLPKILENEETFNAFLKWFVWLMIPLFILGVVQYFSPPEAFVNQYAVEQESGTYEVATGTGGKTRITGTFPFLAVYASYLNFALHILFYAVLVSIIKGKISLVSFAVYGMGIVNIFMTASRGSTLLYGLTEGIAILLLTLSGQARFLKKLVPLALLFTIGFFAIQFTEAGSSSLDDFILRLTVTGDMDARLDDTFAPFKFADVCGPIGFGVGTAQFPMAQYLTNRWEMPGYWEEEGERIVIELGVIGFFVVMLLRVMVFVSCYQVYSKIRKLEYKVLALQMTLFTAPYMVNMQTNIFNYVDGLFYWMAVGLVYFARVLDQNQNEKEQMEDKEEHTSTLPSRVL